MSVVAGIIAAALFGLLALRLALTASPARVARALRLAGPVAMVGAGGLLLVFGRGAVGVPLIGFGIAWLGRTFSARAAMSSGAGGPSTSTVRSAFLDMRLDHETGDMDGAVLDGTMKGSRLSSLDEASLVRLLGEVGADPDSRRLLEAYLDRRSPGWRYRAKPDTGHGLGGAPGAGPMGEEEAHQILGLQPGATLAEIREAHRRLMKGVHPDRGGSHLLAARINEAKAVLIDRHV